jgi:hypothetical protein
MEILRDVATALQTLFGPTADRLGRQTGVIVRQRKFSGSSLLTTIVMTLVKNPKAAPEDYVSVAGRLGVHVTPEAVTKRFVPRLVPLLRAFLEEAVTTMVRAKPVAPGPFGKFTHVFVGDSTTVSLPEEFAEAFPGCGGKAGTGKAAVKIQVLWELIGGALRKLVLEPGKASDAKSALVEGPVPAGSLTLLDLGYFGLKRLGELAACGGFWISRWQQGTLAFHPDGTPLDPIEHARRSYGHGPIDMPILLGARERVACRLVMLRVPQEVAARNRQKARQKARDCGRTATEQSLAWCDWAAYLTNCEPELLSWKEVVILYRTRWQIELLFKLWKSHGQLDKHVATQPPHWQMAVVLAKLVGAILQHWLLLVSTWDDTRRSLRKAAKVVRDRITDLLESWDDLERLEEVIEKMKRVIEATARVDYRTARPSWFQLLENPELLEYHP